MKKLTANKFFHQKNKLQSQLQRVKITKSNILYKSKKINVYGNRVMNKYHIKLTCCH